MAKQSVVTQQIPEHLKFVRGINYEQIADKLEGADIPFSTRWGNNTYGAPNHFRASVLTIDSKYRDDVRALIGSQDYSGQFADSYWGMYEMEEGFDPTVLDGKITFKEGLLVEIVQLYYKET